MNDPVTTARLQSLAPDLAAPSATTASGRDAVREQVKRLAQEFEALLVTQMLRDMRRSMLSEEEPEGLGSDTMTDTVDIELGRALSRVGGFGLSGVLMRALERQTGVDTASPAPEPETSPVLPAATSQPANEDQAPRDPPPDGSSPNGPSAGEDDLKIPTGQVTSAFGWRRDPFTGAARFHRGIDVAQPYGQDVRAAAAGRIVVAGDRGGYGTMVVVEHATGQQTRYAHLAASAVHVGDTVDVGQIIGKSGDSGRTTGPHLHFEVVAGGRAVDPAAGH